MKTTDSGGEGRGMGAGEWNKRLQFSFSYLISCIWIGGDSKGGWIQILKQPCSLHSLQNKYFFSVHLTACSTSKHLLWECLGLKLTDGNAVVSFMHLGPRICRIREESS